MIDVDLVKFGEVEQLEREIVAEKFRPPVGEHPARRQLQIA
jgi:hypothetical protein